MKPLVIAKILTTCNLANSSQQNKFLLTLVDDLHQKVAERQRSTLEIAIAFYDPLIVAR